VSPTGEVRVILTSGALWAPSGVVVGRDGIYVLEHTRDALDVFTSLRVGSHIRVRRIARDGSVLTIARR
jgi:hypothetical protein